MRYYDVRVHTSFGQVDLISIRMWDNVFFFFVNKSQLRCKYRLLIFFFVQLFIIFCFSYYFLHITFKIT